jgi:hypothetical protein
VAEERDGGQTPGAVNIERTFYLPIGEEMVPIFAEMPFPFISPLARELQLRSGNKKGVLREKLIPSGMVEMGGEFPTSDVLRSEVDFLQLREKSRFFIPRGFESPGRPVPPGVGVLKYAGVSPRVEEEVSPERKGGFPI